MHKIAVIGGSETIIGFKALGLSTFPVENGEEATRVFKRIIRSEDDFAIIYVEENLAEALSAEIDKFKDSPSPSIILIPGREGSLGLGQRALKAAVERAVGTDIT